MNLPDQFPRMDPTNAASRAFWKPRLGAEQFRVCFEKGTERPFKGEYTDSEEEGTYHCSCCDAPLFRSDAKFHSGCGWPSYFDPVSPLAMSTSTDYVVGYARTEVMCARCGAHLGHVFPDGPKPTGLRYCINSICLRLEPGPE
jgi:peptide-methionine (R)-S-oxide reductase